jgi:type II secretory pathway pseudopilin PulG
MNSAPAFTLVETLVYIALFGILVGGFVVSAYNLFESNDRNQTKAMLQQEKEFVIGKINWALGSAKTVTVSTPDSLTVTNYDNSTIVLGLIDDAFAVGGASTTNSNVIVSNLVFIHTYAGGTNPDSVEAGFTISALTPDGKTVTQAASTTRYIRK